MRELWQGKSSTPVLEVRNLSRHGEYLNINLRVEAGEVVSIVGLLGAGRTELCLSLFGMTRPDAGEILINGQPVTLHSNGTLSATVLVMFRKIACRAVW